MALRGFSFNGKHSSEFGLIVNKVSRSLLPPLEAKWAKVPNRPGAYFFGNEEDVRVFNVEITLIEATDTDLIRKGRAIMNWLKRKEESELIFDAEPDKTYFAFLTGDTDLNDDLFSVGRVTLQFVCPDPYGYGSQVETDITESPTEIEIEGEEETTPVIVAEFSEPSSFLSIATSDQYIHVGQDPGIDVLPTPAEEYLINDELESTVGWVEHTSVDGGVVAGSMNSDGWSFKPFTYSTGTTWHGPCLKKMATSPAQDFRFEGIFGFFAQEQREVGRIEFYLLDVNGNTVGKCTMRDAWSDETSMAEAYAGDYASGDYKALIQWIGQKYSRTRTMNVQKKVNGKTKTVPQQITEGFSSYSDFYGKCVLERVGNQWRAHYGRIDQKTGLPYGRLEVRWTDTENKYTAPVAGVAVHFAQYGTIPFIRTLYAQSVKLTKINPVGDGQIPNIVEAGDEVVIDCETGVIYKNGSTWLNELSIGSEYFQLQGGQTHSIAYEPADRCTLKVYHRGRYL